MAGRAVCGPEMRLADRRDKSGAVLVGLRTAWSGWNRLRGGGGSTTFRSGLPQPSFVYITHSAVASQFERPLRRPRGRMRGRTRATPPKSGGSCGPEKRCACGSALFDRMTGRSRPHLSLREGLEQTPFPLALHRVGSVLAVKGSLRRFAPWTAPGRSERRAAYEGKGGERGAEN